MSYQRIELSDLYTVDEIEELKSYIATLSEQEKRHVSLYVHRDIARTIYERFPDISKTALRKRCSRIMRQEFSLDYNVR